MPSAASPSPAPVGLSVEAAVAASGIGRTKLFAAIRSHQLKARKFGRRTIILVADLEDFLRKLPAKDAAEAA